MQTAATRPDIMMGHLSGLPNMARVQGSSSLAPTTGGPDIDSAVLAEVLDQFSCIDLMLMKVYCPIFQANHVKLFGYAGTNIR